MGGTYKSPIVKELFKTEADWNAGHVVDPWREMQVAIVRDHLQWRTSRTGIPRW